MHKYAAAARGLADELIASLPSAERQALRDDLRAAGLASWLLWERSNSEQIEAYLSATPSRRAALKAWAEPRARRLLTYGAICCALRAAALLGALDDPWLHPGGSYRDTAAGAGRAYRQLMDDGVEEWPFPELDDPFLEDE